MMSAARIFLRICFLENCSLIRKRTSVLHFKKLPKYSLALAPISFRVRARGGDKQQLRILFIRQSNNLAIDGSRSPGSYFSATDRNNHLLHRVQALALPSLNLAACVMR